VCVCVCVWVWVWVCARVCICSYARTCIYTHEYICVTYIHTYHLSHYGACMCMHRLQTMHIRIHTHTHEMHLLSLKSTVRVASYCLATVHADTNMHTHTHWMHLLSFKSTVRVASYCLATVHADTYMHTHTHTHEMHLLSFKSTVRVASYCLATVHADSGVPGLRLWPSHAKLGFVRRTSTASMRGCASGMGASCWVAPGSTPAQKRLWTM
jgi:hypothetical protein